MGFSDEGQDLDMDDTLLDRRLSEKRRRRDRNRLRTTNMWTGLWVFGAIGAVVMLFAYHTILNENEQLFWIIFTCVVLFLLYRGWTFVSSDEGGAQLAGQLFGY